MNIFDLKGAKIFLNISKKKAAQAIITFSCLALVYHILIISNIIPFKYVWGGKIETREQLLVFETISILLNFFIIYLALSGAKMTKSLLPERLLTILLWFFAGLLFFNTIGNLAAEEMIESIIFTPMTAIMSILFVRIAIDK